MIRTKTGAATLSVISNSCLIVLKLVAGALTGSIAILTEAIHSSIDLLASIVAYFSVRHSDEPPDAEHPYGHAKLENLAAAIEGMLILVGAGIIIYEATRRLVSAHPVDHVGIGIVVIAISIVVNLVIAAFLRRRARELESAALEGDAAHLQTDALSSIGVLVGLVLVEVTGDPVFDALAALAVAVAILVTGVRIIRTSGRVLVDESLPQAELDMIEAAVAGAEVPELVGYHKLRARRSGHHRHVDLHAQFRSGTSLERAHEAAHQIRDAIEVALPGADVLIHVEPEASARVLSEDPLRWGAVAPLSDPSRPRGGTEAETGPGG